MTAAIPRQLSLAVVGADYPNKRGPTRRFEIALCAPGDPVRFEPEPKNRADPHAVMVFSERGVQIGYLTAERAPWIGGLMGAHTLAAVFQSATDYGAVIRLGIDCEPTLPAEPPARADDTGDSQVPERDWWPDEEWPVG